MKKLRNQLLEVVSPTGAVLVTLILVLSAPNASAAPQMKPAIKEGVYRVDWNRKVRDLCVDVYTNEDLAAKDWQGVLAAQGVLCKLSEVKSTKMKASWTGKCEHPWVGKVAKIEHRVTIETKPDGSFDILSIISGDLQAKIPIRGEPLKGEAAKCSKDTPNFRPWG